jgi:hypothetical protein
MFWYSTFVDTISLKDPSFIDYDKLSDAGVSFSRENSSFDRLLD